MERVQPRPSAPTSRSGKSSQPLYEASDSYEREGSTMTKAVSFSAAVALLAKAEALLIKAGQSSAEERLKTLRGVYYGTTWSLDFDVESKRSMAGAIIRNAGFVTYTGGHAPADPRPAF